MHSMDEAPGDFAPSSPTGSSERSVKSCYAVVYHLSPERKWVVSGEGGWSEVHLCRDSMDNSHRLLAWTVKNQTVLLNANVTSEAVYKEKSKNFHSFTDENTQRFGLGFHKSDSGLRQAEHFVRAVTEVIEQCKVEAATIRSMDTFYQEQQEAVARMGADSVSSAGYGGGGLPRPVSGYSDGMPPPNPYEHGSPASGGGAPGLPPPVPDAAKPPPPPSAAYGRSSPVPEEQKSSSPPVKDKKGFLARMRGGSKPVQDHEKLPRYHLDKKQTKSAPKGVPKLGVLSIQQPKPAKLQKHDAKITLPDRVERTVQVIYDKDSGTFAGLPAEWKAVLDKQFGLPPNLVKGTKLSQYPAKIPTVLIALKEALTKADGFHQTGIFRLAPSAEKNNDAKAAIDAGTFDFSSDDINVYANLIKVWFRDLPKPLLACADPTRVETAETVDQVVSVISAFPEPNKSIFLWLCDMCVECAAFEKVNKMGPKNLAIVIGPNLFDTTTFDNPMKAMTYSGKVVDFFEKAIVWRRGTD